MLSHWFERGLGQIVAPDENFTSEKTEQKEAGFWSVLAPEDPKYAETHRPPPSQHTTTDSSSTTTTTTKDGPPKSAFLSPPAQVRCQNCHQWTPIRSSTSAAAANDDATPTQNDSSSSSLFQTPRLSSSTPQNQSSETAAGVGVVELLSPVEKRALTCVKDTAASWQSPPSIADARNKVFRLCASTKPLTDKLAKRLTKLLQHDPSLLQARSSGLGNLVPDGYTPLMAAAATNHVVAADVILSLAQARNSQEQQDDSNTTTSSTITPLDLLHDVNYQGRTALHIASEYGSLNVIEQLRTYYPDSQLPFGVDAPVDLSGHTPLGRSVLSTHTSAQKQQTQLQQVLFSPGDKSVYGDITTSTTKTQTLHSSHLQLLVCHADMPGFRVRMEDSVSLHELRSRNTSSSNNMKLLVGVCDGHGDQGLVSEFVADGIGSVLTEGLQQAVVEVEGDDGDGEKKDSSSSYDYTSLFTAACLTLDDRLKATKRAGGSTAVWALVTQTQVVVANVGDSRCILIQRGGGGDVQQSQKQEEALEEEMAKLSVSQSSSEEKQESNDGDELKKHEPSPPNTSASPIHHRNITVVPLSEDHKPSLPAEQERIEKAGLSVYSETFRDDKDIEHTICKVQRSETDRLAVARAFGDFEYKANQTLPKDEQAVVAVPEVVVRDRDAERDLYLVLACDGIWDVMNNEEVAEFVVSHVEELLMDDECLPRVGDLLLKECLRRGSTDNMTVVLVALSKAAERLGLSEPLEGKALDFQADVASI